MYDIHGGREGRLLVESDMLGINYAVIKRAMNRKSMAHKKMHVLAEFRITINEPY